MQTVAEFCGRELVLDTDLEATIATILRSLMRRYPDADFEAVMAANRKQALVPAGAAVLAPVGTAPGVVVPAAAAGAPTVVVLPGPPRELQAMWPAALATASVQQAIVARTHYRQQTVRMFGLPESSLADSLREAERSIAGFERLEITTRLRRGELEIVTRYEPDAPGAADAYTALVELLSTRHPRGVFSTDGSLIDEQVAALLAGRTVATAESCTAGLLAARLTEVPGSSAYVAGEWSATPTPRKPSFWGWMRA